MWSWWLAGRGVKGRWERQEHQSFPAASWHKHWRQGCDPFAFLSPLSRSLFSFPRHFPHIWLPSFFLYHISRGDVACSLWHLLIVQENHQQPPPPILLGWIPPRISHHMEITHPLEMRDSQSRMYWMELKIYITWQCFCLQSMCRRTVGAILLHFTHYVTVCRVKTFIFIHITSILHCPNNLD